jgi:lysozyme family protein
MTNDDIIDIILKYEGGFTNDPDDRGGPTNFGITADDLGRWISKGGPASADEVRTMNEATARAIYEKWYIADPGFNRITNDVLRLVVVDSGVLFGTPRAMEWLQKVLAVNPDGKFGDQTASALATYAAPAKLARRMLGQRFAAIADIVKNDATQVKFLGGWINRAVSLLEYV